MDLPEPGGADDRQRAAGLDPERDVLQHRPALARAGIREPHARNSTARPPRAGGSSAGASGSVIAGALPEELVDPAHRRRAALHQVDGPAERDHRPDEHREVHAERHELADRNGAGHDQPAARVEHGQGAQAAQQGEQREEEALHPGELEIAREVVVAQPAEAGDFRLLLPVGPDDPHPGKILVGVAGEVAELLLDRLAPAVDPLAEGDHGDRQPQERHQREQRQAGVDGHHGGCN